MTDNIVNSQIDLDSVSFLEDDDPRSPPMLLFRSAEIALQKMNPRDSLALLKILYRSADARVSADREQDPAKQSRLSEQAEQRLLQAYDLAVRCSV